MPSRLDERLNVAIIGAGLGGLSAAVALRRQGHIVTVYERYDFANEVGASLSTASNGSKFLEQWGVDIASAKPVILKRLMMHEWGSGEVKNTYELGDYKAKFGTEYNNFHRIDIHKTLQETAFGENGDGPMCVLKVNHKALDINPEAGVITFENGETISADLIVAADGIRSISRGILGIEPAVTPSTSCCYRCIIGAAKLRELGLDEFIDNEAIEFWGGFGIDKVVMSPCSNGEIVSCYCFYPAEKNDLREDGWNISTTPSNLIKTFPNLDPRLHKLFANAEDIKMWRLYIHEPYPYWVKGKVCLLGDAAHPMLPDQSQGACQAMEDAGALGLIFNRTFQTKYSFSTALQMYEKIRKPRASDIQAASTRARTDLNERIGWSTGNERPGKLTIEAVCGYDMATQLQEIIDTDTAKIQPSQQAVNQPHCLSTGA